jgi:hypothetical protein
MEKTTIDNDARGVYFKKVLDSLQGCSSFEDLEVICRSEESFIIDKFPLHVRQECCTVLSVKKEIDQMALDLMPKDIDCDHAIFPVKIYGDGNCLPRTGSVFAFGDEESHEEIRARIIIESVNNIEKYLDSRLLSEGVNEKHNLAEIYAQYSDSYTPGITLTNSYIRRLFETEILSICKRSSYMGIWQLHALAVVLRSNIYSVHPVYGGYNTRKHLNRKISPSSDIAAEADIHIMWSHTRGKAVREAVWAPNHFVALLPMDKVPDYLEVSFIETCCVMILEQRKNNDEGYCFINYRL